MEDNEPVDEGELTRRAAELKQEMSALSDMLSGYASKYDLQVALTTERKRASEADEERNRWRTAALVATVLIALLALAGGLVNKQQSDARYSDRIQSTVNLCERVNVTANEINKGNDAKKAIVESVNGMQSELDGIIAPLLDDGVQRSPAEQTTYDLFKQHYLDGSAKVASELAAARAAINAAHVEQQNCSRAAILDLSDTTTTTGG